MTDTPHRFRVPDEQFEDIIDRYCNDLTRKVKAGRTNPIIGRDQEIDQIITILLQMGRSNVVLLGGAGVGKTAVFLGLARALALQPVPKQLENARVIEVDFAAMAAGTESRGEFEGRIIPLIKGSAERNAIKGYPPVILCMDEIHTTMRASQASSASGVADVMKPYLTEGNLRVVGATTELEYVDYMKKDPAIERRFQKIHLREPDLDETIKVLQGLRPIYERHFDIRISDAAIEKIVRLTHRYIRNRNNPDKSLMALDAACAHCVRAGAPQGELDSNSIVHTIGAEVDLPPNAIE
ncbi:MAG: AAA family ATPase [Pseudomonadota bacterium]|nr:AAA family ATPase [Pseudomonadota bacterium]